MLYVDLPTRSEFSVLFNTRADACVSIYLKTTPVTRETQASRIELGNLIREAQTQLEASGFDKRRLASLLEQLNELVEDSMFWRFQANSLAIFATPDSLRTYRLANDLTSMVQVADRFHIKPLLRAVTFQHSAFILALSENAVRLVEMHGQLPATVVNVPDLPKDAASALGKSTLNERGHRGRIHASEGQNVRFGQFVRLVDAALRPILAGRETPLILAATGRLASVFAQLNTYPHLLTDTIADSPDRLSEGELAERARPILAKAHEAQLQAWRALFDKRSSDRRTTTDVADAARAATFGGIQTLLVDIDSVMPGVIDEETGLITPADAQGADSYEIVDEIAGRAYVNGAEVLGVRRSDIPGEGGLAAILRFQL